MSKVTTLAHITSLAMTQDNIQTAIAEFYDDTVKHLGRIGFLGTAAAVQSVADTGRYASPTTTTVLMAIFYDDTFLPLHTLRDLESLSANWRTDASAVPLAATIDTEVPNTFTLYPAPAAGSNAPASDFTAFGSAFEANQLSLLLTTHPTNVEAYLEPFLIFRTLAAEFTRESHHQDPDTAALAAQFADLLLEMVQ